MFIKTLILALTLSLSGLSSAGAAYNFDNSVTEISFKISHWSISKVRGTFDNFEGSISYDEKNPEKSSVEVSIDTASINTRNGMRDKHLKSPDFFDAETNPKVTFKSNKVEKSKDGKSLEISGDLTMRGVTKPVILHTTITGKSEDNMGNSRLGFEASTIINRLEYGIAWNKTNKTGAAKLGDTVEIEISGEATLKK